MIGLDGPLEQGDGPLVEACRLPRSPGCRGEHGEVVQRRRKLGVVAPEAKLLDRECSPGEGLGGVELPAALQKRREVVEIDADLVVVGAERPLEDGDRVAEERFRLNVLAQRVQDRGQRRPVGGQVEVVRRAVVLADLNGAPRERLRPLEVAPSVGEPAEVVVERREIGVVLAVLGRADDDCLPVERSPPGRTARRT